MVPLVPVAPHTTYSSHRTFPLNYVARPGDPVTAMIAMEGLRVTPNPPVLMQRQQQQQGAHPGMDGAQQAEQQQQQQQQGASNAKEAQSGAAAAGEAGAAARTAAAAVVPVGTLVRPWKVDEDCVYWTVNWGDGRKHLKYIVGATHADRCELQVRCATCTT